MRIAVNTSGTIAGGAVTHLRHLLPLLEDQLSGDDALLVYGTAEIREQIDPAGRLPWHDAGRGPFGYWRRTQWERWHLFPLLRQWGADVLFHPSNLALRGSPAPQVTLVHNLAPFLDAVIRDEAPHQKLRLLVLRSLTGRALRAAQRTIFISDWGKRLILERFPMSEDPGPVIPFGGDHALHEPRTACLDRFGLADQRYLLSVSHFYRYKQLELLVEAYRELGDAVRELPLVLVGAHFDRGYARDLERRAQGLEGRVVFTGSLPAADVCTLMRGCTVFVFTSSAENLPVTLLEAMALSVPILTNRACPMPEVCGDAALYVDRPEAGAYAAALRRLLGSVQLRKDLAQRALKRSHAFQWSTAAERTLEVLRAGAARRAG